MTNDGGTPIGSSTSGGGSMGGGDPIQAMRMAAQEGAAVQAGINIAAGEAATVRESLSAERQQTANSETAIMGAINNART